MSTERTPLTTDQQFRPAYVFPAGINPRSRRRQMRQMQCCICSLFLGILALGLVITISYSIMGDPFPNTTMSSNDLIYDETTITPVVLDPDPDLNPENILITMPLVDEPSFQWALTNVKPEFQMEAENLAIKDLGDKEVSEEFLTTVPFNSPSYRHQRAISASIEGKRKSNRGFIEVRATLHLAIMFNYTKPPGRNSIGEGPMLNIVEVNDEIKCNFNSRYRTADGTCNNKANPSKYGAAMNPFRRGLNPDYSDGINAPRKSHSGDELPSAREISLEIHRPPFATDPQFTVMLAVWGQFLDHDITATALSRGQNGESIDCCSPGGANFSDCFPVPLDVGDPYYDKYNMKCMNFVRSAPAATGKFGPRQQLNQASAFIDGSAVYSNSLQKMKDLRTGSNGMLRMFMTPDNRTLLPISTDPEDGCNRAEMMLQGKYCFDSGDARANENLHLTSMHLIWARHHNYLAKNLQKVNPEWKDEAVFQEARKILGAQMQHITYNEFLPILIGRQAAEAKGILSNTSSTKDTYHPDVDPTIANEFAGAAFRFAHSLLPSLMKITKDNSSAEAIELHQMLFNPYSLWNERGVDHAMEGAIQTPISRVDRFFSHELTEKLFEDNSVKSMIKRCGLDLVSLNIQRGRDHGLPGYHEWRKHCNLSPANSWEELSAAVDKESLERFKKIFKDPKDIDMYSGALSEPPVENAIFGPTLMCLITDQFLRLKIGDSHWYERRVGSQRFTRAQMNEIYKTTLAGIICQNSDGIVKSRKYVMEKSNNSTNPYVNCTELTNFNFRAWKALKNPENTKFGKINISSLQSIVTAVKNENSNKSKRIKL